jgi:hypothetical protein
MSSQQSLKNNYPFSVKSRGVSPYLSTNSPEGFSFISDGYPFFEMNSGVSKIKNPQTQIIRDISTSNAENFSDYDQANYNVLFPRPSIRDERIQDMRDIILVENSLFFIGSVTIVTLLIGSIVLASFNKTV